METRLLHRTNKPMEGNPSDKWTSLMHHLLKEEFLKECFQRLKRDAAAGVDGVTVKEYEANLEDNIKDLVARMKAWKYRPQTVRRVYIPKGDGSKRPLGIPAVEDKIVQMGMKQILEEVFEGEFLEVSYGFRPNRSCHDALDALDKGIMTKPINYVVDMDIEKFFDTVDHKWLIEAVEQRISDKNILRLIVRFLKAGVMEEGKYRETDKGTPQGGIISPILANIYLHYILDLWVERKVIPGSRGVVRMVRYADDFVICVQYKEEAQRILRQLRERFGKFGLELSEEKTRVIEFGRYAVENAKKRGERPSTFNFLGFTHYCGRTRRGYFTVGRTTDRKRLRKKLKETNWWFRSVRNLVKVREWWPILCAKLRGHFQYYGVSCNYRGILRFYFHTVRFVFKWIKRRSQKKSMNWDRFNAYLVRYPLPRPKIYHNLYTLCCN